MSRFRESSVELLQSDLRSIAEMPEGALGVVGFNRIAVDDEVVLSAEGDKARKLLRGSPDAQLVEGVRVKVPESGFVRVFVGILQDAQDPFIGTRASATLVLEGNGVRLVADRRHPENLVGVPFYPVDFQRLNALVTNAGVGQIPSAPGMAR